MDTATVEAGLRKFLHKNTGHDPAFAGLARLSGGAGRETWTFDAQLGDEKLEGIFRCDPVAGIESSAPRILEFHLLKAAMDAGAIVPEPLWDGDETFPVEFFVIRSSRSSRHRSRVLRQRGTKWRTTSGSSARCRPTRIRCSNSHFAGCTNTCRTRRSESLCTATTGWATSSTVRMASGASSTGNSHTGATRWKTSDGWGCPVDRDRVRFWELFGNLKWGVITITQAANYFFGRNKTVEMASIGRRTAETEWELLRLLEQAGI